MVTEKKKEEADDKDGEEGDDEDAPPKVEVKQVQEEDAFYSIRYVMRSHIFLFDNSWVVKKTIILLN